MKVKLFTFTILCMTALQLNAQGDNPLLKEWNTPYQTPPFGEIKPEHYLPAFEYAIQEAKGEVQRIAQAKTEPTFENTIVALDRSGARLNRISSVFFNMLSCNTSDQLQQIAQKVSPMLTEFGNDINLDPALFSRVKQVHDNPGKLTTEQQQLLDNTYRGFIRSGANLSDKDKETFREISTRMSTLSLDFSQNSLNATNSWFKNITDINELKGIPEIERTLAREKAKSKNLDGWVFDLSAPSYSAIMKYADNRDLRKEFFLKSSSKAYKDQYDNSQVIKDILTCRDQTAKLLGYKNYAEYVLENRMAENVTNVYNLLDELKTYSFPAAQNEIAALNEFASKNGLQGPVERWDMTYYSEKQKNTLYDLNDEMLKPYFKLENVIDGVFGLTSKLYDLTFVPNKDIQVYHPDVQVHEVYRHGKLMAILYLDFHPRSSKRDGAWMTSFREQYIDQNGNDVRPLVSLVMNFTPSTPEQPSLLTFSELTTFMHEFGHALHGMLSEVNYESLSGTSVKRDFVELPSQIYENWAVYQDFLKTFAFHYQTGEVIPESLVKKIRDAENYLAGYYSCRQLSFGYLDMMWHTIDPKTIDDVLKMERRELDKLELLPNVPGACMSTTFGHIFSGGYAAGYYGYKWAEVLDADAFSLFQEKGIFNKEVADSFVKNILSKGGSDKPMNLYVKFRGREPRIEALLKRSGLL